MAGEKGFCDALTAVGWRMRWQWRKKREGIDMLQIYARAARAKSRGFLISLAVTLDGINGWETEPGQSCARAFHSGGELLQAGP